MFSVYKLSCNETGKDYYGSTKDSVETRLQEHESNYKCHLEGTRKSYCSSYEVVKNGNYEIKLLEECDDIYHMIERETFYFDNFECVNIVRPRVPGRTHKEYLETFKEEIAEKMKEYYQDNKEKITEYNKKYYEDNREKLKETYTCECGSTLRQDGKNRHEKTKKHQEFVNK